MGWPHVFKITSYHVGLDEVHVQEMVRCMRVWMPDRKPIWTMVGVQALARKEYLVEVEVKAFA
jgi:enamine deaminase RidA (YjgF/YER057c/UK114 family)